MHTILAVGAGPKAVAVGAKAFVMRQLGLPAPKVVAIDPLGVGGNWTSRGGWTNGHHLLGTAPDKDVGFPYRCHLFGDNGPKIDRELAALSWSQFLVDTHQFAQWIDRGRPAPSHQRWAHYLNWVAVRTELDVRRAEVESMDTITDPAPGAAWELRTVTAEGTQIPVTGDSVLLTGPGPSNRRLVEHPRVLSVGQFWEYEHTGVVPKEGSVVIVGSGETAASVVDALCHHPFSQVTIVSPAPTIYSRGESQFENQIYTDPAKWQALSEQDREDFIARTDRGVFSQRVQERLNNDERVSHHRGHVTDVTEAQDCLRVDIDSGRENLAADVVIDARGGDPLWFTGLLAPGVEEQLRAACGGTLNPRALADVMGTDLAVEACDPTLFIPALSGRKQGPGFANLSCLGELSDRIIGRTCRDELSRYQGERSAVNAGTRT